MLFQEERDRAWLRPSLLGWYFPAHLATDIDVVLTIFFIDIQKHKVA